MIRTRIVEAFVNDLGKIDEQELGWCLMAEVPLEKKPPQPLKPGEQPPQAMVVKVNGVNMFVIGHSWDITTHLTSTEEAVLVLIVQRITAAPSSLVKAPANVMGKLEAIIAPPGGRTRGN